MPEARSLKGNQGIKASGQTFDAHLSTKRSTRMVILSFQIQDISSDTFLGSYNSQGLVTVNACRRSPSYPIFSIHCFKDRIL